MGADPQVMQGIGNRYWVVTGRVVHFENVPYYRYTGTTIAKIIVRVQKWVQRSGMRGHLG